MNNTRDTTPPVMPHVTFISLAARAIVPRGHLDVWYVMMDAHAQHQWSAEGVMVTKHLEDINAIDIEPIMPLADEPHAATHLVTIRVQNAS